MRRQQTKLYTPRYYAEQETNLRKENPPLYGREGDFDVQIQFGRNKHTLFQLLAGDGVGAITTEDEDLTVAEELMDI